MSAKTKGGLGKGFDSLIPQDFDTSLLLEENERIQKLLVSSIKPNPQQPRKHFDEQSLRELAESIKNYGVLQPLVVRPDGNGGYEIIAGERRYRAAQIAGLASVPTIVRSPKELEQLEIALVENVQRVDLSPMEQAISIARLHEQFNIGYADISKRLGKAVSTVNNIVRLLALPEKARKALEEEKITEGHARAILALKGDDKKQAELLDMIIKLGWSVRQAEQFVTAYKKGATDKRVAIKSTMSTSPLTKKLSTILEAPVSIKPMAKGGRLMIVYKNEDDLERIARQISAKN